MKASEKENLLPEEATCKNCPHWRRSIVPVRPWGRCLGPKIDNNSANDFVIDGNDAELFTGEDATCSRHPYWSKEE